MSDDTEDNIHNLFPSDVEPPCEDVPGGYNLNNVHLPEPPKPDMVNHPPHYTQGKVEVIEIIEQLIKDYPSEQSYSIGAAIKYIARAPYKGTKSQDLKKANWYLRRVIEQVRK